jgi:hypothetical protein
MAQEVEYLSDNGEALGSHPSTTNTIKKKEDRVQENGE